jgi:hypothetical protein
MSRSVWCALPKSMAAVLLTWTPALLYANPQAQAADPAQVVQRMIEAARRGDVEEFLSGLTAESRKTVEESYAGSAALREARTAFDRALDERFGAGGKMLEEPPPDLKAAIGRLKGAEVLEAKPGPAGTTLLRVRTTLQVDESTVSREDNLVLQKEKGAWRLALGFVPDGGRLQEQKAAIERITAEVRGGAHKDRVAAMVALANALERKEETGR